MNTPTLTNTSTNTYTPSPTELYAGTAVAIANRGNGTPLAVYPAPIIGNIVRNIVRQGTALPIIQMLPDGSWVQVQDPDWPLPGWIPGTIVDVEPGDTDIPTPNQSFLFNLTPSLTPPQVIVIQPTATPMPNVQTPIINPPPQSVPTLPPTNPLPTNQPINEVVAIKDYGTHTEINDGQLFHQSDVNFEAIVNGSVDKVVFEILDSEGQVIHHNEEKDGDYTVDQNGFPVPLDSGNYQLIVTPYLENQAGEGMGLHFSVENP
jgi:hypothetical protein